MQVPPGHFPPPPPGPSPFAAPAGGADPPTPLDGAFETRNTPVAVAPIAGVGPGSPPLPPLPIPPPAPSATVALGSPPAGVLPAEFSGSSAEAQAAVGAGESAANPGLTLPAALAPDPSRPEPTGPISLSRMSKMPPPRRGRGLLIALGLFVFFGVAALAGHLATRPWLVRPEDDAKKLERRFREVQKLAEVPRRPARDAAGIIGAAHLASGWTPSPGQNDIPQLDKKKLTKDQNAAVEALVKWTRGQGTFTSAGCVTPTGEAFALPAPSASALAVASAAPPERDDAPPDAGQPKAEDYYRLGRLSLETTPKARRLPIRVRGVLKLAHLMRSQGNLEEYVTGLKLSRDAALWMKSRKQGTDAAFQSYRPRANQLRGALARQAVCSFAMVEGLEGWHFDVRSRFPGATSGPPLGLVSYVREGLVLQDFHSRVLHETRRAREISELIEAYRTAERPKSVVLDVTSPDSALLDEIAKLHAEYDQLVPSAAPRPGREPSSRARRARPRSRRQRPKAPADR